MRIAVADFETSAADEGGWPDEAPPDEPDYAAPPEIAFVGRSNVGKSSLLNVLAERHRLARTSNTPGRTRLINFFRVSVVLDGGEEVALRLVDLPGYGYAKVSKQEHAGWRTLIERYLSRRKTLRAVVVLCDARRAFDAHKDPSAAAAFDDERDLCAWLAARGRAVIVVVTKIDKLAKHERMLAVQSLRRILGDTTPAPLAFSAETNEGKELLWRKVLAKARPAPTPAS